MKASRALLFFVGLCALPFLRSGSLVRAQGSAQAPIVGSVELVQVPVIVFDEKGAVATNLKKGDFRLMDDGVVQQILYLDKVRKPVSFVVVADLSSSMTRKIPFVQEAAISLLDPSDQQVPYPDEYSVLGIGTRAHRLASFTRDQADLARRLPVLLTATNESTALFDGIYLGVTLARQEAANQRRAMIIISDGGDNHSLYNIHETRALLQEADVPVFAVMAGPTFELPAIFTGAEKKPTPPGPLAKFPGFPMGGNDDDHIGPAERRGPHNLSVLTEVTGGGVFTARKEEDLSRIVRTIGLAVRYQYVLTYKPLRGENAAKRSKKPEEDGRHKVHVELYPKESFKGYSIPYYRRVYSSPE